MQLDQIIIESSPFLRCLQTSSRIAKANDIASINVNYLMVEDAYCAQAEDGGNPIESLDIKAAKRVDLEDKGLAGVKIAILPEGDSSDHYLEIKEAWGNGTDDTGKRCTEIRKTYL